MFATLSLMRSLNVYADASFARSGFHAGVHRTGSGEPVTAPVEEITKGENWGRNKTDRLGSLTTRFYT
jgi:hypothetical protein